MAARSAVGPGHPSEVELQQAFAIADTLIPARRSPGIPAGNPLFVPDFAGSDFPRDFISDLLKNHPNVKTELQLEDLGREGPFYLVDGVKYLPSYLTIRWIHQTSANSAEAMVFQNDGYEGTDRRIVLEFSSGKWRIKTQKIVTIYD
jgi:hypothetical protein